MKIEKIREEYRKSLLKVFEKIDACVRAGEMTDREGILAKARIFQTYRMAGKIQYD